jgi:hypothetical protein
VHRGVLYLNTGVEEVCLQAMAPRDLSDQAPA